MFRLNLVKFECLVIFNLRYAHESVGEGSIGGYPNHVKSLKGLVFKETVEPCWWTSETRNLNSGLKQLMKITYHS